MQSVGSADLKKEIDKYRESLKDFKIEEVHLQAYKNIRKKLIENLAQGENLGNEATIAIAQYIVSKEKYNEQQAISRGETPKPPLTTEKIIEQASAKVNRLIEDHRHVAVREEGKKVKLRNPLSRSSRVPMGTRKAFAEKEGGEVAQYNTGDYAEHNGAGNAAAEFTQANPNQKKFTMIDNSAQLSHKGVVEVEKEAMNIPNRSKEQAMVARGSEDLQISNQQHSAEYNKAYNLEVPKEVLEAVKKIYPDFQGRKLGDLHKQLGKKASLFIHPDKVKGQEHLFQALDVLKNGNNLGAQGLQVGDQERPLAIMDTPAKDLEKAPVHISSKVVNKREEEAIHIPNRLKDQAMVVRGSEDLQVGDQERPISSRNANGLKLTPGVREYMEANGIKASGKTFEDVVNNNNFKKIQRAFHPDYIGLPRQQELLSNLGLKAEQLKMFYDDIKVRNAKIERSQDLQAKQTKDQERPLAIMEATAKELEKTSVQAIPIELEIKKDVKPKKRVKFADSNETHVYDPEYPPSQVSAGVQSSPVSKEDGIEEKERKARLLNIHLNQLPAAEDKDKGKGHENDYSSMIKKYPYNSPTAIRPEVEGDKLHFHIGDKDPETARAPGKVTMEPTKDGKLSWKVEGDIKAPKTITVHDDNGNLREVITLNAQGKITEYKAWDEKNQPHNDPSKSTKFNAEFLREQIEQGRSISTKGISIETVVLQEVKDIGLPPPLPAPGAKALENRGQKDNGHSVIQVDLAKMKQKLSINREIQDHSSSVSPSTGLISPSKIKQDKQSVKGK